MGWIITFVLMARYLFVLLLFVAGCSQPNVKTVEKPDDLIPQDKMIQVLAEVHLLEATLNVRNPQTQHRNGIMPIELRADTNLANFSADPESKAPIPWYNIFNKFGITKKQYESSMKYYCSQPELLNTMYDEVITELTKRQLEDRTGKR